MKDIFLTKALKKIYLEDYLKAIDLENEFWRIEDFLIQKLNLINSNSQIQTLYSKYGGDEILFNKSYLVFCYTKEVEEKIFKIVIPKITSKFSDLPKSICTYKFEYPRANENYKGDVISEISCTDNKEHFRINHIRLELKSRRKDIHQKFWDFISQELSVLI